MERCPNVDLSFIAEILFCIVFGQMFKFVPKSGFFIMSLSHFYFLFALSFNLDVFQTSHLL